MLLREMQRAGRAVREMVQALREKTQENHSEASAPPYLLVASRRDHLSLSFYKFPIHAILAPSPLPSRPLHIPSCGAERRAGQGAHRLVIFAGLAHLSKEETREAIEEAIEVLGLGDYIDRLTSVYSGGIIRRLCQGQTGRQVDAERVDEIKKKRDCKVGRSEGLHWILSS